MRFWESGSVLICAMVVLAGCTGPVHERDVTPAGPIEVIEIAPKRAATSVEQAAVLKAVSALPGSAATHVEFLQVQSGAAPVLAFCGVASGLGPRGELTDKSSRGLLSGMGGQSANQRANVSGMFKTVDDKVLAFDLRFGDFAAQRCEAMGFVFSK